MPAAPADTPEARFALQAALLLHETKRGGGGSSGRARRSLHIKIVSGFAVELSQTGIIFKWPKYIAWLEHNTPDRGAGLPVFLNSPGPTLFPRVHSVPPAVPASSPSVSTPPSPSIRALGTDSERVAGSSGLEASGSLSVLPSGRKLPPQPPVPKAKTGIPPSTAPNVGPYLTLGQRAAVISPNNPLLRVRSRSPPRSSSIPSGSASSGVGPEREREAAEHLENPLEIAAVPAEEAAEEILESAEEAAEETLDSGAAASSGVGPERATPGSGAGPERELRFRPVARQVTSLKVAEGLLPPGTSVLLSLDIHLVADRDEAGTSACLERILREHSDLAVIFCSYAVKQKTIDKAVQCIHRICDRTIVRRPLTFPIFFTTSKTAPGTGKGAQLSKLANIFSRSRPAPLTSLYHVDDQDPICKNVTSYGHHGVTWAEEDPRSLDQIELHLHQHAHRQQVLQVGVDPVTHANMQSEATTAVMNARAETAAVFGEAEAVIMSLRSENQQLGAQAAAIQGESYAAIQALRSENQQLGSRASVIQGEAETVIGNLRTENQQLGEMNRELNQRLEKQAKMILEQQELSKAMHQQLIALQSHVQAAEPKNPSIPPSAIPASSTQNGADQAASAFNALQALAGEVGGTMRRIEQAIEASGSSGSVAPGPVEFGLPPYQCSRKSIFTGRLHSATPASPPPPPQKLKPQVFDIADEDDFDEHGEDEGDEDGEDFEDDPIVPVAAHEPEDDRDYESSIYKYKDLKDIKLPQIPGSSVEFRAYRNSVLTQIASIDCSGKAVLLKWLQKSLDPSGSIALTRCHASGTMPSGRALLSILSRRYRIDKVRGPLVTLQSLFDLEPDSFSYQSLVAFKQRVEYVLNGLPERQWPDAETMFSWIYSRLKGCRMLSRTIDRVKDAKPGSKRRTFEYIWNGLEEVLAEVHEDRNEQALKDSLKEDSKQKPKPDANAKAAAAKATPESPTPIVVPVRVPTGTKAKVKGKGILTDMFSDHIRSTKPLQFETGNGVTSSGTFLTTTSDAFGSVESYVLQSCPVVRSLGQLVELQRKPFVWLPGSMPFFGSDEDCIQITWDSDRVIYAHKVDDYVPVFREQIRFGGDGLHRALAAGESAPAAPAEVPAPAVPAEDPPLPAPAAPPPPDPGEGSGADDEGDEDAPTKAQRLITEAQSTPEAEMISMASAMFSEVINLQTFLQSAFKSTVPIIFFQDNETVLAILKSGYSPKLRHLGRVHRVNVASMAEIFEQEDFSATYVNSKEQLANGLTKIIPPAEWSDMLTQLCLHEGVPHNATVSKVVVEEAERFASSLPRKITQEDLVQCASPPVRSRTEVGSQV
ncbi:unnamed protein product [Symbiodinium sp. CCMP2592]|nr:unnamed protein product [Symbiodinium sp. CCMP2592]